MRLESFEPREGGGIGGDGSPSAAVEGIFSIEAYPDSNRLIVISKTPENYRWLDEWIVALDQPFNSGLPVNVPLKHAGAVELSEILNTLLASSGSEGGGLRLPEEGIQGLSSSFNSGLGGESDTNSFNLGSQNQDNQLRFPWQGTRAGQGAGGLGPQATGCPRDQGHAPGKIDAVAHGRTPDEGRRTPVTAIECDD